MSNPLLSLATANQQAVNRGALYQSWAAYLSAGTTAATVNCGGVTMQRMPQAFINYAGVDDSFAYDFSGIVAATAIELAAFDEYDLGTLTVSGNSFAAGVSAPTKTPSGGSSGVCVFNSVVVFIAATLTATNPVLTITYTDQDGNTGNTATLTLPTNAAINSVFQVYPHLATGDTGIRAITNVSISTGSAGSIKVMGLLELANIPCASLGGGLNDVRNTVDPVYPVAAGETIAFYTYNTISSSVVYIDWVMVPTT